MKNPGGLPNPEGVLRCGCGAILRRRSWADHWRSCWVGAAREATAEERKQREWYEADFETRHGFKPGR